jgi:hypothetical protein
MKEPDWNALVCGNATASGSGSRCLVKEPRNRLRDIGDARIAIDEAVKEPAAAIPGRAQAKLTAGPARAAVAVLGPALRFPQCGICAKRRRLHRPRRVDIVTPATTDPISALSPTGSDRVRGSDGASRSGCGRSTATATAGGNRRRKLSVLVARQPVGGFAAGTETKRVDLAAAVDRRKRSPPPPIAAGVESPTVSFYLPD